MGSRILYFGAPTGELNNPALGSCRVRVAWCERAATLPLSHLA